jgi:hypothetical protein
MQAGESKLSLGRHTAATANLAAGRTGGQKIQQRGLSDAGFSEKQQCTAYP